MMKAVEEVKAHWLQNGPDYIQVSRMIMLTTLGNPSPIETPISGYESLGECENSHTKI